MLTDPDQMDIFSFITWHFKCFALAAVAQVTCERDLGLSQEMRLPVWW